MSIEAGEMSSNCLNLLLIGTTGNAKSSLANSLLEEISYRLYQKSARSVFQHSQLEMQIESVNISEDTFDGKVREIFGDKFSQVNIANAPSYDPKTKHNQFLYQVKIYLFKYFQILLKKQTLTKGKKKNAKPPVIQPEDASTPFFTKCYEGLHAVFDCLQSRSLHQARC